VRRFPRGEKAGIVRCEVLDRWVKLDAFEPECSAAFDLDDRSLSLPGINRTEADVDIRVSGDPLGDLLVGGLESRAGFVIDVEDDGHAIDFAIHVGHSVRVVAESFLVGGNIAVAFPNFGMVTSSHVNMDVDDVDSSSRHRTVPLRRVHDSSRLRTMSLALTVPHLLGLRQAEMLSDTGRC